MTAYNDSLASFAGSIGELAEKRSIDLIQAFDIVSKLGIAEAELQWNNSRANLGRVANVEAVQNGTLVPGICDEKPPVETLENSAAPAAAFTADLQLSTLKGFGADLSLSIQRASKMSPASIVRVFKSLGQHVASGPADTLADSLTSASLPAGQTATVLQDALQKFSDLRTPGGGMAPDLAVLFASPSLKLRAADEFWANAFPIVWSQFLPAGVCYLLPAPESDVIAFPILKGMSVNVRPEPGASAGWRISCHGFAAATVPVLRSSFFVRCTLA